MFRKMTKSPAVPVRKLGMLPKHIQKCQKLAPKPLKTPDSRHQSERLNRRPNKSCPGLPPLPACPAVLQLDQAVVALRRDCAYSPHHGIRSIVNKDKRDRGAGRSPLKLVWPGSARRWTASIPDPRNCDCP
jgi:hypothetical protein